MLLKKLKWSILSIGLVFSMIGCSNVSTSEEGTALDVKVEEELEPEELSLQSGLHQVEIVVKDFGSIIVELDADVAPITVTIL